MVPSQEDVRTCAELGPLLVVDDLGDLEGIPALQVRPWQLQRRAEPDMMDESWMYG